MVPPGGRSESLSAWTGVHRQHRRRSTGEAIVLRKQRSARVVVHFGLERVAGLQRLGTLRFGPLVDSVQPQLHRKRLGAAP